MAVQGWEGEREDERREMSGCRQREGEGSEAACQENGGTRE